MATIPSITRIFNYFGEKVTIEVAMPNNKEHNEYRAEVMKCEDDDDIISFRAAAFDERVMKCSKPKDEILDTAKSSVMFQLFENFSVDPKN